MSQKKYLLARKSSVALGMMVFGACGQNSVIYSKETPVGQSIGNIKFDQSIWASDHKRIAKDLQVLDHIPIRADQSGEMRRIMKLKDTSPASMRTWLEDRVQYIVPEHFNFNRNVTRTKVSQQDLAEGDFQVSALDDSAASDESSSLRTFLDELPKSSPEAKAGKLVKVASNVGVALYDDCDTKKDECSVTIQGHGKVRLSSPRTGIIQIGEGLFLEKSEFEDQELDDISYTISRLGTLFHEARHSDGNRKSPGVYKELGTLGFYHVQCPKGHDLYQGKNSPYACDENLNGPYTIGALVVKSMVESCQWCSAKSKEGMRVLMADQFGRVVKERAPKEWDDTPEGKR
jgi:hypothetical protein